MPSKRIQSRERWLRRRDAWLAQHPTCADCGTTPPVKPRLLWRGTGPAPVVSMSRTFRLREELREPLLADCVVVCHPCWRLTLKRNSHGGGKTGITGCRCEPCVTVRKTHYGRMSSQRWTMLSARRVRKVELGAVIPKRAPGTADNNKWNKSQTGIEYKRLRRQRLRDEWLAGRQCGHCGAAENVRVTWVDYPGPMRSTAEIWTCGPQRRAELLEKCHTLCVSCIRTVGGERRRAKEEK